MEKAPGIHPKHVTAHIITPEEKKRILGRDATVETQIYPGGLKQNSDVQVSSVNKEEVSGNPPQQESDDEKLITGIAAIKVAMNVGSDHVWLLKTGEAVSLEQAKQLGDAVYFDFEVFDAEVDDEDEDEVGEYLEPGEEEVEEILSQGGIEPVPLEESEALLVRNQNIPIPPPLQQGAEDKKLELTPAQKTGNKLTTSYFENGIKNTRLNELPVDQRREMSWGAVLSAPGLQVYMHPRGIVRVNLDGKIRIQKAIEGNVRVLRLTRLEQVSPKANIAPTRNPAVSRFRNQDTVTAPNAVEPKKEEPEPDATEF